MASNSRRKYGSSAGSTRRKRVEIGTEDSVRVRYDRAQSDAGSTRRTGRVVATGSRAPRSHQGKRLASSKRDDRERRLRSARLRAFAILLAVLAALIALGWGATIFATGKTFHLREVSVTGVRHLSEQQVRDLARIAPDTSVLTLNTTVIRKRVEADPWVESARLDRRFPDALVIHVTEREPAAVVDTGGTELWVVSPDGYWLGLRSAAETGVLSIRDLEAVEPVAGKVTDSEILLNAVRVAAGLSRELKARTRVISAPTIERTALILDDDVEVFIGDAEGIAVKDRIAREILEQHKGRLVYINVRVVSSPTWRGLDP